MGTAAAQRQVTIICQLIAISHLLQEHDRDQILEDLANDSWEHTHQVLTRWAWCKAQEEMQKEGKSFSQPFMGQVGEHQGRKNLDREFYMFLNFLPEYRKETRQDLLFDSYRGVSSEGSPDFLACTEAGSRVGIEITEAQLGDFNKEAKMEEKFTKDLKNRFQDEKIGIIINLPHGFGTDARYNAWSRMASEQENIAEFISKCVAIFKKNPNQHRFFYPDLKLSVSLSRTDACGVTYGLTIGNAHNQLTAKAVADAIKKKLDRRPPSIRPCMLLLYPNGLFMTPDWGQVVNCIPSYVGQDPHTHFDEIWLLDNSKAIPVWWKHQWTVSAVADS